MPKKVRVAAVVAADSLSAIMKSPAPSNAQCIKAMLHRREVRRKIEDLQDLAHKDKDPW